jgi:PAS domain S-box-containing protein
VLNDKLLKQTDLLNAANQRLAELIELSQQLVLERDSHRILEKFCQAAREIIGAKYATIGILDPEGSNLRHFLTSGLERQMVAQMGYPSANRGLLGQLLAEGQPIRLRNLKGDPQVIGLTANSGAPQHPLIHSFLGAPIASSTRLYGWLYLGDKIGAEEFSEEDEQIITTLAAQVAVAYENSNRYDEIQRHTAELEQEIAERKRAEEELANERHTLRTLIDNLPDFIYLKDTESRFITGNIAMARFTEAIMPEELVGRTDFDFFPQELALKHYSDEQTVIQSGRPLLNQEETFVDPVGRRGWLSTTKVPLRDNQGKIVGIVGIGRDITEPKRLQEQLLHAQKMEAVGQLAGGVAHDFNNILVVITGYAELLLQRHLDEADPIRRYVEEIRKAGERATTLTRQLLAFSRKQMLQLEVLNLNDVVANMENMLRRLTPGLGQVKTDWGQLEQVIMNLAVNARDAMSQGGKLTVETDNIELDETYTHQYLEVIPGPYVMLAVSDTGIGMDTETQSHLFEPFFTTKEAGKGTGLGLATSYGIIKQSGGHIAVYSEPGKGTTFKVYLPRLDEPVKPLASPSASTAEQHQRIETVLVVEDEVEVGELIDTILTQQGFSVLRAGDGNEALQLCEQYAGPIHLLLTDVVMPGGMNGRELAGRLVALYPSLKVLYMSGYTDDAIVNHGVLDPDTAFLHKPFTPEALIRKALEVLNASSVDPNLRS